MSNRNKTKTPPKSGGNVISLDALLGNWPVIELGGVTFEGRHFNQTEKAAWIAAEQAEDPIAQRELLQTALASRGAQVDAAWVEAQPDLFLAAIARGLFGAGWPGENPK